jgi:hypothetical protein
MLASLLFPYDDDAKTMVDGWLEELQVEGCISRYSHGSDSYIQICNWLSHQKIDKPSQSKIPPFDESSRILSNPREVSLEDQGSRIKDQGKDIPPLAPKGATKKTPKVELDCSPEAEESLRPVYQAWPTQDPNGGKAHKGPFAAAARAFQKIIDSGEATARELKGCGMLYAKAELYPDLKQRIMDAWEYRDQAIMHVSTFYGTEKKPYRQLLPLAREAIAHADEKAKQQQPILLEAM